MQEGWQTADYVSHLFPKTFSTNMGKRTLLIIAEGADEMANVSEAFSQCGNLYLACGIAIGTKSFKNSDIDDVKSPLVRIFRYPLHLQINLHIYTEQRVACFGVYLQRKG